MIVLVALVAMLMAVMAMVVLVAVVVMMMVVIMTAAAGGAVGVLMRMRVVVLMIMAVAGMRMAMVVIMTVIVMMVTMVVVMTTIGVVMVMDFRLGLERPLDLVHRTALAANQFSQHRIVLDIDHVRRDLSRDMEATEVPGEARQPERVLSRDRDKLLRRRLDQHERAVFELDRVAVVQRGRLVEVEQNLLPAIAPERGMASVAAMMVESEGLDDPVLLDRGLADDGGGALHDETRSVMDQRRSTDRGSTTSITGATLTQVPAMARKVRRWACCMCRSTSARFSQFSTLMK